MVSGTHVWRFRGNSRQHSDLSYQHATHLPPSQHTPSNKYTRPTTTYLLTTHHIHARTRMRNTSLACVTHRAPKARLSLNYASLSGRPTWKIRSVLSKPAVIIAGADGWNCVTCTLACPKGRQGRWNWCTSGARENVRLCVPSST